MFVVLDYSTININSIMVVESYQDNTGALVTLTNGKQIQVNRINYIKIKNAIDKINEDEG